jgi:hypothetical protein
MSIHIRVVALGTSTVELHSSQQRTADPMHLRFVSCNVMDVAR